MKARLKVSTTINADAHSVFKYLGHSGYHHLWNSGLERVVPETILTQDASYTTYSTVLGVRIKAVNYVVKFVPDKELEIRNQTGMLQYGLSYKLEPRGDTTEVACTTVVSSDSKAFAFAKPMMEQLARRELRIDLAALKQVVEQGAEQPVNAVND